MFYTLQLSLTLLDEGLLSLLVDCCMESVEYCRLQHFFYG